jgi:hypothetical protein
MIRGRQRAGDPARAPRGGGSRPPVGPAHVALALQRAAGNRATERVLSRYTEATKAHYEQAGAQVVGARELIEAVLGAHKATFEFKGAREPEVAKLRDQIDKLAATLADWEKATTAEAEKPLLKQAAAEWKLAKELRAQLLKTLGGGDEKKGEEAVNRVLKAQAEARKTTEAQQARAAADAAKRKADAERLAVLMAVYSPSPNGGPAYARPAADKLPEFAEYVRLRHPAFAGLTDAQLRRDTCPLYRLTGAQLASVESFAGRMPLSDWREETVPTTRSASLPFARWMVPTKVGGLLFELGAEIFADWVVPKQGHGFAPGELLNIWSFVDRMRDSPFMTFTEDPTNRRRVYEYKPRGYTETKVITKDKDRVLITCYDVRTR